jgi:hypothetical protein
MDMQLERQYCIDNMGETLYERMITIADDSPFDSISIYEEWIVDGEDPEDNGYKFIFLDNFTLETT